MAKSNFFGLNDIHPVIKDFIKHHDESMRLYIESHTYLVNLDERLKNARSEKEANSEFHSGLSRLYSAMETAFSNFFVSYYALQKLAQLQPEIMKEFKKIPADIAPVQKQFNEILMGFREAIG